MCQRHRIAIGFEIPQSSSKDSFPKSWPGQIFFKPVDQLGNVDRLSHNWIPLNAAARSGFGFRHQRGEKDDGRSLQLRITIDLSRYLASIFPWHHYVQQDQIRPEILGTLMSFDSVVLFVYDVAACFFEKNFEQVSTVPVVINNKDASLFFHCRPLIEFRIPVPVRWCPIAQ